MLSAVYALLSIALLRFVSPEPRPVLLMVSRAFSLSAALPWPAMSTFMHLNIVSIVCLLDAAINSSCALCYSWRRVNIIAVVLPSSSAAASSCTARAGSLKHECFAVACEYC
jgi:hypothetical protein